MSIYVQLSQLNQLLQCHYLWKYKSIHIYVIELQVIPELLWSLPNKEKVLHELSVTSMMRHSFTKTKIRTYIAWTLSMHNNGWLARSLHFLQDPHGMIEKKSTKPDKTATCDWNLNWQFPEYKHMISPRTERLQMEHWKISLLQTKQPAPLTLLLQYWHSE